MDACGEFAAVRHFPPHQPEANSNPNTPLSACIFPYHITYLPVVHYQPSQSRHPSILVIVTHNHRCRERGEYPDSLGEAMLPKGNGKATYMTVGDRLQAIRIYPAMIKWWRNFLTFLMTHYSISERREMHPDDISRRDENHKNFQTQ